jgi:hypothetical protein
MSSRIRARLSPQAADPGHPERDHRRQDAAAADQRDVGAVHRRPRQRRARVRPELKPRTSSANAIWSARLSPPMKTGTITGT